MNNQHANLTTMIELELYLTHLSVRLHQRFERNNLILGNWFGVNNN